MTFELEPLLIDLTVPKGCYEVTLTIKSESDTVFSVYEENIGYVAENETIKNGEYPIYTNGYIVSKKGDEVANKWIENVISTRGSKIIEEAGYVPMY